MFRCLVCGYNQMPHPPKDYNICPCCGTEYGLDDAFDSYELLRDKWLEKGAPWMSQSSPYNQPQQWNAWDQLDLAGYHYSVPRPARKEVNVYFDVPLKGHFSTTMRHEITTYNA